MRQDLEKQNRFEVVFGLPLVVKLRQGHHKLDVITTLVVRVRAVMPSSVQSLVLGFQGGADDTIPVIVKQELGWLAE